MADLRVTGPARAKCEIWRVSEYLYRAHHKAIDPISGPHTLHTKGIEKKMEEFLYFIDAALN